MGAVQSNVEAPGHTTFWQAFDKLSSEIMRLPNKNYALLRDNPSHPGLHFKKVGRFGQLGWGYNIESWALKLRMERWSSFGLADTKNVTG